MIHPTAIIHPKARLDATVQVGPYAVIDEAVEVGAHCVIGPHVHLTGTTVIGTRNRFHTGCVIGDAPQDLKYDGAPTRLRIGDGNVFREFVTVHRSTRGDAETRVGSNNYMMVSVHVAHNCEVGDHVILANSALLAGHAVIEDRAFISGNCLVHQFTRVGTLAMMQGGSAISKDLPPFTVAAGDNSICGLNVVGLRRAGLEAEERAELKRLYHALFRSNTNLREAAAGARNSFPGPAAQRLIDFLLNSERGVCTERGRRSPDETPDADISREA